MRVREDSLQPDQRDLRQWKAISATMSTTPPNSFDPTHEILTVPEFAKRVGRNKMTAYKWIRLGQMPPGSVLEVQKLLRIDWTIYAKSIRVRA